MTLHKKVKEMGINLRKVGVTAAILTVTTLTTLMGGSFAEGSQSAQVLSASNATAVSATILPGGCYPIPPCKQVILNGHNLALDASTKPMRADSGELLVPLKRYAQELGMKVTWKAAEKAVEIEAKGKKTLIPVSSNRTVKINGGEYRANVIDGKLYVAYNLFVDTMGAVAVETADYSLMMDSEIQQVDEASTVGEIAELVQGKDGVQILVKGSPEGQFGLNEISLAITKTTPVKTIKADGKDVVQTASDLKKGDWVYVKYSKAVTKSLPAIGQVISVDVLKACSMMTGKIYEVSTSQDGKNVTSLHVMGRTDYVLHLDSKAVVVDALGKELSVKDLKAGQMVRATIAQFATMSIPAQTTAYKIEVVK